MRGSKEQANAEAEHIYSATIHWQELNGIGRSNFKGKCWVAMFTGQTPLLWQSARTYLGWGELVAYHTRLKIFNKLFLY